jgi:hypothetical protein
MVMADVALAAAPLSVSILTSCLKGYRLFTEARNLSGSQSLTWKFKIQHIRLQVWGQEWGLLARLPPSDRCDTSHDHQIILESLLRISDILKDYGNLKKRYGLSLVLDEPGSSVDVSLFQLSLHLR